MENKREFIFKWDIYERKARNPSKQAFNKNIESIKIKKKLILFLYLTLSKEIKFSDELSRPFWKKWF